MGKLASEEQLKTHSSPADSYYLSFDEIEATITAIQSVQKPTALRDSAILVLLLHTGLTANRLTDLDVNDVNLRTRKLRLHNRMDKPYYFLMDFPIHYLEAYLIEGRPNLNPYPGESALFISQMGLRLTRQGVWQILKHWGQMSRISHPLTGRAIHNTAALKLAEAGNSLEQIQILLGHSNPKSTLALLHRLNAPIRG
jgi:integrase/recombinase XerD